MLSFRQNIGIIYFRDQIQAASQPEDPLNFNFNPLGNSKDISELSFPFKGKGTLGWGDGRGVS